MGVYEFLYKVAMKATLRFKGSGSSKGYYEGFRLGVFRVPLTCYYEGFLLLLRFL